MSAAKMGAFVRYCGHSHAFVADIWRIDNLNIVVANGPLDMRHMPESELAECTHHLTDLPSAGYWNPRRGFFVVPEEQVVDLSLKNP